MNATGQDTASAFGIVAVAASAGGVVALSTLVRALGVDFPVPVLIVQHLDPRHETTLAEILDRRLALGVKLATAGERVEGGTVYLAPPDHHLLVDRNGVVSLSSAARTQFVRPSADLLFESVAESYGSRAIACVLTGTGKDGAKGVQAVKAHGGTVIVEDPETAEFSGMPQAAMDTGAADLVLPLQKIPSTLNDLLVANRS